jgi:hypothetical protein
VNRRSAPSPSRNTQPTNNLRTPTAMRCARSGATLLGILLPPAITSVSISCGSSPSASDVVRHHRDTLTTGGGRTRFSRVGARRFPRNGSASRAKPRRSGTQQLLPRPIAAARGCRVPRRRQSGYAVEISLGGPATCGQPHDARLLRRGLSGRARSGGRSHADSQPPGMSPPLAAAAAPGCDAPPAE